MISTAPTPTPCDYDDLFTITCSHCHTAAPYDRWRSTAISGELPPDEYQCPQCNTAFIRRKTGRRWPYQEIECAPIAPRL